MKTIPAELALRPIRPRKDESAGHWSSSRAEPRHAAWTLEARGACACPCCQRAKESVRRQTGDPRSLAPHRKCTAPCRPRPRVSKPWAG
ncbi:Hypothetical protein A7982_09633 [Minicystis rosea]|nr:Hypothetical protein A7982_09633 [Minicystis rosea]